LCIAVSRVTLVGVILSTLPLNGCSAARDSTEEEVGGLPILEEVSRFGCLDCQGPELLSVLFLTVTSDGTVYVLDRYEPFVRVFDSRGELRHAFGVAGQGPGELGVDVQVEFLPGIAVYPRLDGSMLVHEAIPPTLTAFDAGGNFTEEVRLDIPVRIPRGSVWDAEAERVYLSSAYPGEGSRIDRFDLAGQSTVPATTILSLVDTFPPIEEEPPRPATPLSMALAPGGGIALGNPWTYRIRMFEPDGAHRRDIQRQIARPRKSDARMSEERELLRQRAARSGGEVEDPHPDASHFRHGALDFDDTGRLWVATNRGGDGNTVFDLFDRGGAYLGEVSLPASLEPGTDTLRAYALAGGLLVAVVVDPNGNHSIGVWRTVET
jgi:hypothetical protein